LPGWLRCPLAATGPLPLVVLFNGAGIVKEEMTLWSDAFLERGLATLAFDGPGCGELRGRLATDRNQEDITGAILDWAAGHPAIDGARVALLGVSFGGAQVIHHAARNPRVAACVSVTPPFHPAPYIDRVHPFVMAEIASLCGATGGAEIVGRSDDLSCIPFVGDVHCPTLVVGAGFDAIIPPTEARRLYDALSCPKTFLYLRGATHIGLSHIDLWTAAAADWLDARLTM
jgi:2,6-dihydroxypseudooxynicotine hydrolase